MMRFEFTISHVSGTDLIVADTLSRAPAPDVSQVSDLLEETEAYVKFTMMELPATEKRLEEIKILQSKDEACQLITSYLQTEWPEKEKAPALVRPYLLPMRDDFSIQQGLLMRSSRMVIPPTLRKEILQRIHNGHQGIAKCRERARQSVWWPRISTELEELVGSCITCCKEQQKRAEPMQPSKLPELPWQRVGTNLFERDKHLYY